MRCYLLAAVAVSIILPGSTAWGQLSAAPLSTVGQPAPTAALGGALPAGGTPYLGVQLNDVAGTGLVVGSVVSGGPSELGGLRAGDVVRQVNGQAVSSNADFGRVIAQPTAVGTPWQFVVNRQGVDQTLNVIPTPQNSVAATSNLVGVFKNRGLGVNIAPLTPAAQTHLRIPEGRGAVVTSVYLGSPAYRAGIPNNAVIMAFDGRAIGTPEELRATVGATEPTRAVSVRYYYQGQPQERTVVLDPRPNVNTSFASTAGATTAFNSGGTVTAATDPRFASNVGTHSTSLDHTAQEVRRLEQRVVEVERKLREFEAQAPRR